jgi:integrase
LLEPFSFVLLTMKGWLGVFRYDTFTPIFTPMKVTVTIELHQNKLRLRWTCPHTGKRKNLALGVEDSTTGRSFALDKKDEIETDIKNIKRGHYDPTLLKYRPKTIGKNASEITTVELFDRFTQHKHKHDGVMKSSIKSRYEPLKRMLEKYLNIQTAAVDKRRAVSFADVCVDTLTPSTAKARIMLLKSAWEWGKGRYELADENPWAGIATVARFKSIPVQPVAAFTKDEAKKIIDGFRNSRYYSHYADFVVFRLSMGTRGGESSALKWKHLSTDFTSVWIGESFSRGVTGTTKTKKARTVKLDPSVSAMLQARHDRLNPLSGDELVFKSPEGLAIDDRNFNRRAWKTVLAEVGVNYRRPYNTRKTAITLSLKSGTSPLEVAAAAGHDPQTLYEYYSDVIQEHSVFVSLQ